jgi:5'-deoxynucleotidase YfbR-like HD superfamily hydrolase
MVQVYRVSLDEKQDTYDLQTDLKRLADDLPKQADRLRQLQLRCREDFERDRMKAADDLEALGAEGLAQALRGEVSFPEDAAGAEDLSANIDETIHLIALEKQHAESGVSQLLEIKKHFEDQCLQICLNIRTELDKLPKMSVISMDNEKIQMVGLRIPYINENLYAQRMSDYIENIVKAADKLSALVKCIEELRMGNDDFLKAKFSTERAIRDLKLPEADEFMERFMPSFSLTIDEF